MRQLLAIIQVVGFTSLWGLLLRQLLLGRDDWFTLTLFIATTLYLVWPFVYTIVGWADNLLRRKKVTHE